MRKSILFYSTPICILAVGCMKETTPPTLGPDSESANSLARVYTSPVTGSPTFNYFMLNKVYREYKQHPAEAQPNPNAPQYYDFRSYAAGDHRSNYTNLGLSWYTLNAGESPAGSQKLTEFSRIQNGNPNVLENGTSTRVTTPPGYSLESDLGRVLGLTRSNNEVDGFFGTQRMDRYQTTWSAGGKNYEDFITADPNEAPLGYGNSSPLGMAWPRKEYWEMAHDVAIKNNIIYPISGSRSSNNGLNGTLGVGVSKNFGGQILSLMVDNKEFCHYVNAGTGLQMAANAEFPREFFNPTQGGDAAHNGSPLILLQSASGSNSMDVATTPLLWKNPTDLDNLTSLETHPYLYNGIMITKSTIEPNYTFTNGSSPTYVRVLNFSGLFKSYTESRTWGFVQFYLGVNSGRFGDDITPQPGTNWLTYGRIRLYVKNRGSTFRQTPSADFPAHAGTINATDMQWREICQDGNQYSSANCTRPITTAQDFLVVTSNNENTWAVGMLIRPLYRTRMIVAAVPNLVPSNPHDALTLSVNAMIPSFLDVPIDKQSGSTSDRVFWQDARILIANNNTAKNALAAVIATANDRLR